MPELPEVEQLAIFLRERAVGHVVAAVMPVAVNVLKTFDPQPGALAGMTLDDVTRRGKFLDLDVGGLHLVLHLARAGWLRWKEKQPTAPARPGRGPLALRVVFDDGAGFDLTEAGTQKRLAVYVVRDPSEVPGVARLGIDPLDPALTLDRFRGLLATRQQIKGVLTDQTVFAGVGNAYSDEILWAAQLSPFKPAANLSEGETARLHDAMVTTVREAVRRAEGVAAADLKSEKKAGLAVHARTGEACPRCGDTVREVSFADKSLQYCASCQTGGKPLADRRMSKLLK
jgi:formamidopyrimidine-DNA glycosylase